MVHKGKIIGVVTWDMFESELRTKPLFFKENDAIRWAKKYRGYPNYSFIRRREKYFEVVDFKRK